MSDRKLEKTGRGGISLFKIAGIQINIDFSWFIIFLLVLWSLSAGYFPRQFPGQGNHVYWIAGLLSTFLFFFSVLFHELSHSLMAIHFGIQIPEIKLFIFGGISRLSEEAKTPDKEFKIAVIGPLSSFFLAGVFWICQTLVGGMHLPVAQVVFGYLTWINIALGIFNLLPGFPLDGGRVLRALIWHRTGSLTRATKWASDVGKGLAVALMVLGAAQIFAGGLIGGLWLIFIGMFLRGVAEGGYQEVIVRQSLQGVQVQEVMVKEVVHVPGELTLSELINHYLLKYGYKGFPVLENGSVAGVISLTDVQSIPEEKRDATRVADVMRGFNEAIVIAPTTSLAEAMQKMAREGISRLLVMERGTLVGMITKTGLLRFLEIKRILEA